MRRLLLVAIAVTLVGVAAGYGWHRYEQSRPLPEKRGSRTVEFVPAERPAQPRPKVFVRNEPWPTYGYDLARARFAADLHHRPPYRRLWMFRTGNVLEFPPIVVYDRVLVAQQRGRVFALEAASGEVAWRKHFRHCSAASPVAGKSTVYFAFMQPYPCHRQPRSQRGLVVAIRVRGGRILWRYPAGVVESSPLLVGGVLYFGSWDRHLYALDVRREKPRLLWRFEADDEINTSPAYAGGRIFFGTNGGRVYAVDAKTGALRWRAESFARAGGREYFYATPAIAYGRVYIGNTDGNVYAFGAGSGRLLWARNAGSYVYSAAAIWNETVYVGSYDGNVYAFDAATGDVRWTYDSPGSIHGAPTVIDGVVYFSTCGTCGQHGSRPADLGPRTTFALDARTGKRLWTFPDGHYSPIVADRERVYLTGSTRVYALEPARRTTSSRSPAARSAATATPASGQTR